MLNQQDLRVVCRGVLAESMAITGSEAGVVYLLDERRAEFERFESLGVGMATRDVLPVKTCEGGMRLVLETRQFQHVTGPVGGVRSLGADGGTGPGETLLLPVVTGPDVVAVVALASSAGYGLDVVREARSRWGAIAVRLSCAFSLNQLQAFAKQLEQQNEELEEQKRELTLQARKLNEQNAELEKQKARVDEANRLKSAFLSNISHDLKTPLNAVIALAGVLRRRLAGSVPEQEQGFLEVIERNGKSLLALINGILDLARLEAGREVIRLSHFSVRELAAEVLATIEPLAMEKGIALRNRVGGEVPTIQSDLVKCRHILQNLVGNAVRFTAKGSVEVSAVVVGAGLAISVKDTGIGIPAMHIPHIFDEFRQADDSTATNYGGTGLGLAIARKYATLLGGAIRVDSTPEEGSTFTLRLPLWISAPCEGDLEEHAGSGDGACVTREEKATRDGQTDDTGN